jgi:hypothetical protein
MTITIRNITKPGFYPAISASSIAVKANDVTIQAPRVDGASQVLYGIDIKKDLLRRYYKRTKIVSADIQGAQNKGVLGAYMNITGTQDAPTLIHDIGQDGVYFAGDFCRVEWTKISRLGNPGVAGDPTPHADGIGITVGTGHAIANVHFELPHEPKQGFHSNACIYIESDFGPIGTVDINSCILDGGLYSLFCVVGKYGPPEYVRVRNCKFLRHYYKTPVNWNLSNLPSWLDIDESNDFSESTQYQP